MRITEHFPSHLQRKRELLQRAVELDELLVTANQLRLEVLANGGVQLVDLLPQPLQLRGYEAGGGQAGGEGPVPRL